MCESRLWISYSVVHPCRLLRGQLTLGELEGLRAPGDLLHLLADLQPVELAAGETERGLPLGQVLHPHLVGKSEQTAGYLGGIGEFVRCLFRQDVPDYHQQLASNGDDGLLLANVTGEGFELRFPVSVVRDGVVGRIDHRPPKVAPPGFGDSPGRVGHAAVMHP